MDRATGLSVVLVLFFGTAASLTVYGLAHQSDLRQRQTRFDALAEDRIGLLRSSTERYLHEVHALMAFFSASEEVTRDEFRQFASMQLVDNPEIQALEWIPQVPLRRREEYVARARAEGLEGFEFTEFSPSGSFQPASPRDEYFPVFFVEPMDGNQMALGFDVASDVTRLRAVETARATGRPAATSWIPLVQDRDAQDAVLIVYPVNDSAGGFEGVVTGVLQIDRVLDAILSPLEERPIVVEVTDVSPGGDRSAPLHWVGVNAPDPGHPRLADSRLQTRAGTIYVADKTWRVVCEPLPESELTRASLLPPAVLALGLVLTLLVAAVLLNRGIAERRFRAQQASLFHLSRVATTGELASSLAHELNQPLCAIVLNAQTAWRLARDPDQDLEGSALETALTSIILDGERAGQTIEHLREFLRRGEPVRRRASMNRVVLDALALVHADETHARPIAVDLDPLAPQVSVDVVQIQQVILNLVLNGMEAMEGTADDQGGITVSVSSGPDHRVTTRVRDRGPGVGDLNEQNLFSPFFTTKSRGMGIGLSICRSIIEAHDGRIWVEEPGGRGACFAFSLPVMAEV